MNNNDVDKIKARERNFRETDEAYENFLNRTKTKWWSLIELWAMYRYIKNHLKGKLLDVGCNDARVLSYIRRKNVNVRLFGTDFAVNPLKQAIANKIPAQFFSSDASALPVKENIFDAVVSLQVLQHLPSQLQRQKAFQHILKCLKPEGVFVASFLNRETWKHLVENGKEGPLKNAKDIFVYLYEPDEIKAALKEVGFDVLNVIGVNHMPARLLKQFGVFSAIVDHGLSFLRNAFSFRKSSYILVVCRKK